MPPKKAKSIMIQGTGSGVGKSVLAAALCRYFAKKGVRVAPFKAQNMALNSFVTCDGLEMGRAQVYQAEACGLDPDVRMNPILLKPNAENHSQVVLMGKPKGNKNARDYYKDFPEHLEVVQKTYDSLASEFDLIIIEGAGSPAEINLQSTDLVNMRMAEYAGASVLIVGDIDRGGVFAWMKGTFDLLRKKHQDMVKGFIINKFRGDQSLLQPGITMFEDMVGRPVVGVVPFAKDMKADEEDSISWNMETKSEEKEHVNIGIVWLPRISNFTDFSPLALEKDVSLSFLKNPIEAEKCDCLILPGSKSTLSDALHLSKAGWYEKIVKFKETGKIVVGICGGYQMLGESISDPVGVEGDIGNVRGMGLLPVETELETEKTLNRVTYRIIHNGFFHGSMKEGEGITGYEIHMGKTKLMGQARSLVDAEDPSLCITSMDHLVLGTYVHGLFDSDPFRRAFINKLRKQKNYATLPQGLVYQKFREEQFEGLRKLVETNLDMERIHGWVG